MCFVSSYLLLLLFRYFATGGADGVAAVWSFQDLSCIGILTSYCVCNQTFILFSHIICPWYPTGTMNRLTMDVNSVSFSRGGSYLACASK